MTHEARNPPPPVTHTLPFSFSVSAAISKTSFQHNDQPPQQVKLLCSSIFLSFLSVFVFFCFFVKKKKNVFVSFLVFFFSLIVRTLKGLKDPAHPNLRGPNWVGGDWETKFFSKIKPFKFFIYLYIEGKFRKSNPLIECSYYIFYVYKISRRSNINCYVIKQIIKFQVFMI